MRSRHVRGTYAGICLRNRKPPGRLWSCPSPRPRWSPFVWRGLKRKWRGRRRAARGGGGKGGGSPGRNGGGAVPAAGDPRGRSGEGAGPGSFFIQGAPEGFNAEAGGDGVPPGGRGGAGPGAGAPAATPAAEDGA